MRDLTVPANIFHPRQYVSVYLVLIWSNLARSRMTTSNNKQHNKPSTTLTANWSCQRRLKDESEQREENPVNQCSSLWMWIILPWTLSTKCLMEQHWFPPSVLFKSRRCQILALSLTIWFKSSYYSWNHSIRSSISSRTCSISSIRAQFDLYEWHIIIIVWSCGFKFVH